MKTERPIISIVKGNIREIPTYYSKKDLNTIKEMITKSLKLIAGTKRCISGANKVMIKPNHVEIPLGKTGRSVLTDPRVLESLVGILKDYGGENVYVGKGKSLNLKHKSYGSRKVVENSLRKFAYLNQFLSLTFLLLFPTSKLTVKHW